MLTVIILIAVGAILIALGVLAKTMQNEESTRTWKYTFLKRGAFVVGGLLIAFGLIHSSLAHCKSGHTLHFIKRTGTPLPQGYVVARSSDFKGPQAKIVGEGFHFSFLLRLWYDIEELADPVCPPNKIMVISAKDGRPLPPGTNFIPPMNLEPEAQKELLGDASKYLADETYGFRGTHTTAIRSGRLRLNQYLFSWEFVDAPTVPANEYGIVSALVAGDYGINEAAFVKNEGDIPPDLDGRVVEINKQGVWRWAIRTGAYPFNPSVFKIALLPKSVSTNTLVFKGGVEYLKATPNMDDTGKLTFTTEPETTPTVEGADSEGISIQPEGFDKSGVDYRFMYSVVPQYLPYIYARYPTPGDLNKFIIAKVRSRVRQVANSGQIPTSDNDPTLLAIQVLADKEAKDENQAAEENNANPEQVVERSIKGLDYLYRRGDVESITLKTIEEDLKPHYIQIVGGEFGGVYLNGLLRMPQQRAKIASDNIQAFKQEELAQQARIQREKTAAEADQQDSIVTAEITKKVTEELKEAAQNRGDAESNYVTGLQEAYSQLAGTLGEEKAGQILMTRMFLQSLNDVLTHPEQAESLTKLIEMIPVPEVLVNGGSDGSSSQAALAGILSKLVLQSKPAQQPAK